MSAVAAREEQPASGTRTGPRLVLTACPLCGADEGEPVAVGGDTACQSSRETFLALGCPVCGLVYLNPRPASEERIRLYPPSYFGGPDASGSERAAAAAVRRLVRRLRPHLPAAHVLEVGCGPRLLLASYRALLPSGWSVAALTPHLSAADHARASGLPTQQRVTHALQRGEPGYDLVILFRALEHWDSPVDELASVRKVLRAGGRVLVLTPNPESAAARAFRGRHWTGYDFPRHPCLFGPSAMRRLAETTGLEVERLGSVEDTRAWSGSAGGFLRDWGAPGWLVRTGTGLSGLWGRLRAVPGPWRPTDSGALLEAVLQKAATAA